MTTNSSRSQSQENLIDHRYRIVAELYDVPLGKFCRAQDRRDGNKIVAFIKLKQIITRLPTSTVQRLREAITEASKISVTTLARVEQGSLNELYIAMAWFDGEPLPQWLASTKQGHALHDIVNLVTLIAYAVHYPIENNFKWVRPSLDPQKILVQQDRTSRSDAQPTLTDLGFAELLLDNPAYENGAPLDIQATIEQLAVLLLSLLLENFNLHKVNWQDRQALEEQLKVVEKRYANFPREIHRVLAMALPGNSQPHFRDPRAFAEALQKALASKPQSVTEPVILRELSEELLPVVVVAAPPNPPRAAAQAKYRLDIYDDLHNEQRTSVLLSEAVMTAGLSADDQILLPRVTAQRLFFVRLEGRLGDRYTITDTSNGSTNPENLVLLDGIPLSPEYAALLVEYTELKLAGYTLMLSPTLETAISPAPQQASPLQAIVQEFSAQPGERINISVHIQNQTKEVDRFWLVLDGAPSEWQVIAPPARQLFEQETLDWQLVIRLPLVARSYARLYPLTLRLISENLTAQIAAIALYVELLPAYDFAGELVPQRLRVGQSGIVYLENHGNLSRVFRLTWRDQAQELIFDPADTTLLVRAGEVGEVSYRAYVRHWRWIGREQSHPIHILATPQAGGIPQNYAGQIVSRALIPAWAPIVVLLLIAAAFLLATTFLKPEFANHVIQPEGIAVAGNPFVLSWTPLNTCFTAVAQNGQVRRAFEWRPGAGRYAVDGAKAQDIIEVRLRNCLFMAEKTWSVQVVEPTPSPPALPEIVDFQISAEPPIAPTLQLLLGQSGDLCIQWDVRGSYATLKLEPSLPALAESNNLPAATGKRCLPIQQAFTAEDKNLPQAYKLIATTANQERVESTPIAVPIARARCYVNTLDPIALYEGPGRVFPIRGYLERRDDNPLFVLSQPFMLFEQGDNLEWVQLRLINDPRPGWVLYNYLYCPHNIRVMPVVDAVPPTPVPAATPTPLPTPTTTPTTTPLPPPTVSIAPDVINLGGCTKLKWEIQNVKEVYLNDEGVVGVAEREECPTEAGRITYTWRIVQNDGSTIKLERQLLVNGSGPVGAPTPPIQ